MVYPPEQLTLFGDNRFEREPLPVNGSGSSAPGRKINQHPDEVDSIDWIEDGEERHAAASSPEHVISSKSAALCIAEANLTMSGRQGTGGEKAPVVDRGVDPRDREILGNQRDREQKLLEDLGL